MITAIAIENFKGIGERVEIELRPITLLFGANSAGKSTILHALHYAREVFERGNYDADRTVVGGKYIDLGGFKKFVHGRDLSRPVRFSFRVNLDDYEEAFYSGFLDAINKYLKTERWTYSMVDSFGIFSQAEVGISIQWSEMRERPYVSEFTIDADGERFATITSDPDGRRVALALNLMHPSLGTLEMWYPGHFEPEEYPQSVYEVFEDASRSCLAQCMPAFLPLCRTVSAEKDCKGENTVLLIYLEGLPDALPEMGEGIPIALREEDDFPENEEFENPYAAKRFAHDVIAGISRLILIPLQEVVESFSSLLYLGPLRETPPRDFIPPRFPDLSRLASGLGAWDRLFSAEPDLVDAVSRWLGDEDRLNSGYHLRQKNYKEVDLADPLYLKLLSGQAFDDVTSESRDLFRNVPTKRQLVLIPDGEGTELSPHDVGIGISQVIPVIVTALDGENQMICIEQPELHLHPKLQAELGDLFIESAKGSTGHTLILETHSEVIPLRLMRRIREWNEGSLPENSLPITNEDVAIYYVESYQGSAIVRQLEVSEDGKFLDPWPDGFFEEGFRERFGR